MVDMPRARMACRASIIFIALCLATPLAAQKAGKKKSAEKAANLPAVIWRQPGDVASLNLIYGSGGRADAPDPKGTYTFVKEDPAGTSPKFDVEDALGVGWGVKLGEEPQSETAATRLLWAAGYFTDEDYYLPELTVKGLPILARGQNFVSSGGTVHYVRLKRRRKEVKAVGDWDWFDNPFHGTRELNGLRVMMSLVNNWDLSTLNNAVEAVDGERRYLASDLGATFGNTGNYFTRSKSDVADYANTKFIERATPDAVDFVLHSRPFVLSIVNVFNYRDRTRMEQVTKHIPRADAKWLGQQLGLLSAEQLRDAFRAAGYTPEQVEGYVKVVQQRIAALNAL